MAEEVFFRSGGVRCAADLYLPRGAKKKRPALVIGHGFSCVKAMLTGQAEAFQKAGFVVLAVDYRTFGNSEGKPRGQLIPLNEVEDVRNAISYLEARPEVDATRIGMWGTSFGGALATYVGAVDRRLKAIVAQVPVTDGYLWMKLQRGRIDWEKLLAAIDEDRARRYAGKPSARIPVFSPSGEICGMPADQQIVDFFAAGRPLFPTWADTITLESIERILEFSPLSMADRICPRPYLIVTTAGYDIVHPADTVADLYARARHPKRIVYLPYEQVGLYFDPGLSAANAVACEFFCEHLM